MSTTYSTSHTLSSTTLTKKYQDKVPRIVSWTMTLVQSAPRLIHHHHLLQYSTNLSLYLIWLNPLPKLHLQCSILTIIMGPPMRHLLSQSGQSQLISWPSSTRKHSKNHLKIWQMFLSFPHLTSYNQLSLLTKHGTDCPSHSLSWIPLLQFKSSISF